MLGLDTFYPTFTSQNFTNNSDVISLNFGPIYDPDSADKVVITITITPSSWSNYFTVDPLSVVLKVNNLIGLLNSNTIFKITIFLQDSNFIMLANSTYIISLDFCGTNVTSNSQNLT